MRIFISQIFISDLYIFTFIFRSSYFETASCLHTFGSSSSSHTVLILSSSRFHHAIIIPTLQLDIFTSSKLHLPPLSGQPSSSSDISGLDGWSPSLSASVMKVCMVALRVSERFRDYLHFLSAHSCSYVLIQCTAYFLSSMQCHVCP